MEGRCVSLDFHSAVTACNAQGRGGGRAGDETSEGGGRARDETSGGRGGGGGDGKNGGGEGGGGGETREGEGGGIGRGAGRTRERRRRREGSEAKGVGGDAWNVQGSLCHLVVWFSAQLVVSLLE